MATPTLRLDTSHLDDSVVKGDSNVSLSVTPSASRNRARSLSHSMLPAFKLPTPSSPSADKFPSDLPTLINSQGASKARTESRKLLDHLLTQLHYRPVPSSSNVELRPYSRSTGQSSRSVLSSARDIMGTGGSRRNAAGYRPVSADDSDSDGETETLFSTDSTFDLMNQLKDVLIISEGQHWDILNDSPFDVLPGRISESSSEKRSGYSLKRRSRIHSRSLSAVTEPGARAREPQLLSRCISVLASVILEDCRFSNPFPRPTRPPSALQALTLDIAQFLIHTHQTQPHTISQIAFAVIPAFYTFNTSMHSRLLAFFDDVMLGHVLEGLNPNLESNTGHQTSPTDLSDRTQSTIPMVSIMVDEAETPITVSNTRWNRWSMLDNPAEGGIQSSYAPGQHVAVYQLSAVIPPLFAAIFENVDLSSQHLPMLHRFYHLLDRLVTVKHDVYLDMLSTVAYHTSKARYSAIQVLLSFWPRAFGHIFVTKAFPQCSYSAALARTAHSQAYTRHLHDHANAHQFIPWRFRSHALSGLLEGVIQNECWSCTLAIAGFGLLCPFCSCAVHFDCYDYPEGNHTSQYALASNSDKQKIIVYRFCHTLPHRRDSIPATTVVEQHTFRTVNLFSLTLCMICRLPLWGYTTQALRCNSCKQFAHRSCLARASAELPRCRSVVVDKTSVTIEWNAMRTSFLDHYRVFPLDAKDLVSPTYEEVSAYYAVLWVQLQFLQHGIALGSIVISQSEIPDVSSSHFPLQEFELHKAITLYESQLSSGEFPISDLLADHFHNNHLNPSETFVFFEWTALTFITGSIKSPLDTPIESSPSILLSAGNQDPPAMPVNEPTSSEILTLGQIRDQLGCQFQVYAEPAARCFLVHLSQLGLFQAIDGRECTFDDPGFKEVQYCFPLPIGLEVSPSVETLVAAVESCMSDLDLSVNEAGLLLLVRRLWPDGMLTDYCLRRLCGAVLYWILSEDYNVAIMLRDFVAKGRTLPGVRSPSEAHHWPSQNQTRPALAGSSGNGGDYIATRRLLLEGYVSKWLLALHDLDVNSYAETLWQVLVTRADEDEIYDEFFIGKHAEGYQTTRLSLSTDKLLRQIIKLSHANVLFTAFDDVFKEWLKRTRNLGLNQEPLSSLSRLFNREVETSQRFSTMLDPRLTSTDTTTTIHTNALRILIDTATGSRESFRDTIHWLCLFVRAGVDIAVPTLGQFANLARRFNVDLDDCLQLARAILWSTWLRSTGRQNLQSTMTALHAYLRPYILDCLQAKSRLIEIIEFVRQSLAVCLLVYGCERPILVDVGFIQATDIQGLPSKRKLHGRNLTVADPVIVDMQLMDALGAYVSTEVDEIVCLVGKFLKVFANDTPMLESFEVDNFVLRNSATLCTCVWQMYGVQTPELSTVRPALLLRVLVVEPHPLQTLLDELFEVSSPWETRLQAVLRLFRIILDVTNPAFNVEDRQWRQSVIFVFEHFFARLWAEDKEEVRVAVDTWSQTLHEAHFEAIALCFSEALMKLPVSDRVQLVAFLNQLHCQFPIWRVLSWDVITETLLEDEYVQFNGDDEDGPASAHLALYGLSSRTSRKVAGSADPELITLRASLVSLALRMVSDGIPIEQVQLIRIKEHVIRLIGYATVTMVPAPSGRSFHIRFADLEQVSERADACLNDLMVVLDSPQPFDLSSFAMGGRHNEDETSTVLVGSVFVDVLLDLFVHSDKITCLPFITLKNLLKSLMIILHKHDMDSKPLKHLQANLRRAVNQVLDLLSSNISYELRQLALSTCQISIKRWSAIFSIFAIDAIEAVTRMMSSLNFEQNEEDPLVVQGKAFLETTLSMFASGKIFNVLFKRTLTPEFFQVIRFTTSDLRRGQSVVAHENLKDTLLRDTLGRSLENVPETFQVVIENIHKYVEIVHHSGYTADSMQAVGLWLTGVARRTAEWSSDTFDPSPLLLISCILIQHNKLQIRDFLVYLETLLRAVLIRCNVSADSLTRLLETTSPLYRKSGTSTPSGSDASSANPILSAMLEIASDGTRGRARVSVTTLMSLFEALAPMAMASLADRRAAHLSKESVFRLAVDALLFVYEANGGQDTSTQPNFEASQAAAQLVLGVAEYEPTVLDRLSKISATLPAWNILCLTVLTSPRNIAARLLFNHFSVFSLTCCQALDAYQPANHSSSLAAAQIHSSISNAYIAIKLWLLLVPRVIAHGQELKEMAVGGSNNNTSSEGPQDDILVTKMVWNTLWPPFERTVSVLETGAYSNTVNPLAVTAWSSVADLLVFLRQARLVTLEPSSEAMLLQRVGGILRNEAKLSRIMRSVMNPTPVPSEYFVNQISAEMRAEAKFNAARRQEGIIDRGKRIVS